MISTCSGAPKLGNKSRVKIAPETSRGHAIQIRLLGCFYCLPARSERGECGGNKGIILRCGDNLRKHKREHLLAQLEPRPTGRKLRDL